MWVFDPFKRRTWRVDFEGWHAVDSEDASVALTAGEIRVVPKEIFDLASV